MPATPAHTTTKPTEAAGAAPSATSTSASSPAPVPPAEAVTPLIRGIAVLRRLTEAGGTLSPSALERATGLARSTVDRITATLARMGYVRLDGRDVVLTPRLMELGNAHPAALRLPALLDARADALADELDESVSLAAGDRDGIRFIHQATRRRAMSLSFRIGDRLPAERTAPGPLFATEWTDEDWRRWRERRAADPEDRGFPAVPPRPHTTDDFERRTADAAREGWALDDQLIEPGLVAVSVPVRDPATGRIACVANVVSHTSRHTAEDLRATLLPRLRETVTAMERDLAPAPPPPQGPPPADLATWTAASKQELGRDFVESLARGLTVLTAFEESRPGLGAGGAGGRGGMSHPVRRGPARAEAARTPGGRGGRAHSARGGPNRPSRGRTSRPSGLPRGCGFLPGARGAEQLLPAYPPALHHRRELAVDELEERQGLRQTPARG